MSGTEEIMSIKEVLGKGKHWFLKAVRPEPKPPRHPKLVQFLNRYALIFHFAASFFGYLLIEALSRHSFGAAVTFLDDHTKVFLYNTLLIFLSSLIVFLFRRRTFWRILVLTFWMLLGISNSILLANRVTPLTGPDLTALSEGASVVTKYLSGWEIGVIYALIIALVAGLIVLLCRSPRYQGKTHRIPVLIGIVLSCFGFWGLTREMVNVRLLSAYFENIAYAYEDYGFPYCLTVTVLDTGISKPDNYSKAMVDQIIADEHDEEKTTSDTENLPNIIIVQCETFFDPTRMKNLTFSEDPLPNWHKLEKEYTSGLYQVPVVGAGTVNTEFETLTGMSMRFFGAGEYPYKGILREETCESAATVLKNLGFSAHAVHDNEANFYSRRKVYADFGFDTFTSGEYMDTQNDVNENGWMRDENLITPINDALDSTSGKDFVFTVSVQPHGSYPSEHIIDNPEITVTGTDTDAENAAWEYYVNQLHEEDQFIADLIQDVENRGEPAVILFYGDHLPTMGLSDEDLNYGSIYQTNYLLWDNIGLKKESKDITAYQAAADLFDKLDIHDGVMFRYQQTMQNSESYTFDMQTLQYDILYGKRYVYNKTNPFKKSDLRLGVKPIVINGITKLANGTYYISGENFTQSCKAVIDGKLDNDTIYVNSQTLMVNDQDLNEDSMIKVAVQSNSSTHKVLSSTYAYKYSWFTG